MDIQTIDQKYSQIQNAERVGVPADVLVDAKLLSGRLDVCLAVLKTDQRQRHYWVLPARPTQRKEYLSCLCSSK
jgi:hypothetical protein